MSKQQRRYTVGQVGGSAMMILDGERPVALVYNRPERDEAQVAAELAAAPAMAEALEAQDALVAHIRGCESCEDGEPCEAGRRMVGEADRLRREALAVARGGDW